MKPPVASQAPAAVRVPAQGRTSILTLWLPVGDVDRSVVFDAAVRALKRLDAECLTATLESDLSGFRVRGVARRPRTPGQWRAFARRVTGAGDKIDEVSRD